MEVRTEVKSIKVEYKCPKCPTGYLEYSGLNLGFWNEHGCNNKECNHAENVDKKYPYIKYEKESPMEQFRRMF